MQRLTSENIGISGMVSSSQGYSRTMDIGILFSIHVFKITCTSVLGMFKQAWADFKSNAALFSVIALFIFHSSFSFPRTVW